MTYIIPTKILGIAGLIGSGLMLAGCGGSAPTAQQPAPAPVAQKPAPAPTAAAKTQGYQAYSANAVKLAKAQGKDTAVFFHSKTCGSCAKLDGDIVANAGTIPANTAIFKADRDENQALAKEYGVDKYHTVSLLKDSGVQNVKGLFTLSEVVNSFKAAPEAPTPAPTAAVQTQGYQAYSANAVKLATAEGKDTAVFFHSKTCGSCAKLDANINANLSGIPADTVVFKADWDENQALAKELNVDKYHTVSFLDDAGNARNVKGLFELKDLVAEFDAPVPTAAGGDAGDYQAYSADAVKLAQADGKKTAIFFHSKTCGSCAKLDGDIVANAANIPSDVALFKADWDENQALAKELNVDKYHTVSFLDNTGKATNVKGLFTLNDLTTKIN